MADRYASIGLWLENRGVVCGETRHRRVRVTRKPQPEGAGRTVARVRAQAVTASRNVANTKRRAYLASIASGDFSVEPHRPDELLIFDGNSRMANALLDSTMAQRDLEASSATSPGWLGRFGRTLRAWSRSWL